VTDPELTVKGLKEGVPYEFRVAAVNEAGPGEWAEVDEAIKPAPPPCMLSVVHYFHHPIASCLIQLGAPKIMLDPFMSNVTANAGEPFKIKLPFKGNPIPESEWFNVSLCCLQLRIPYMSYLPGCKEPPV
jgi:hypothetical protein